MNLTWTRLSHSVLSLQVLETPRRLTKIVKQNNRVLLSVILLNGWGEKVLSCITQQLFPSSTRLQGNQTLWSCYICWITTAYDMLLTGKAESKYHKRKRWDSSRTTKSRLQKWEPTNFVQPGSYPLTKEHKRSLAHHRELLLSCTTITEGQPGTFTWAKSSFKLPLNSECLSAVIIWWARVTWHLLKRKRRNQI